MQREVVLSKTAKKILTKLIIYLKTNWSEKVKKTFLTKLEERIHIVQNNPVVFPNSKKKHGLYKCVVTRQTTMFYTFDKHFIYILTIFNNRQNPDKLNEDLL